jgi:hypothetical protein
MECIDVASFCNDVIFGLYHMLFIYSHFYLYLTHAHYNNYFDPSERQYVTLEHVHTREVEILTTVSVANFSQSIPSIHMNHNFSRLVDARCVSLKHDNDHFPMSTADV